MPDQFQHRSHESARLEGFSNAVFAFAVTLLVVTTEVPLTFGALRETMLGFVPFAFCFSILMMIWYFHYQYFRRYGLADGPTFLLNALLLFVVLFYVYPLKFMGAMLVRLFSGASLAVTLPTGATVPMLSMADMEGLFLIYSGGYLVIFLLLAGLYGHAYRQRDALDLSRYEQHVTRIDVGVFLVQAGFGMASLLIAVTAPPRWVWLAGAIYMIVGPAAWFYGWRGARAWKMQQARAV